MATPAIDLQEIPVGIDTLDATDPVDRNLQVCYNLAASIAAVARAIEAPGAGFFLIPDHWKANPLDRTPYENAVTDLASDMTDALIQLKLLNTFVSVA